jgi:glycosyltransferase involved in cell wall biosynthesis
MVSMIYYHMNNLEKSIVIIGPAYPLRGGLATFNERLARQFMSEGFQTSIYTFSLQYPGFLFPGTTQYSDAPAPADLDIKVRINSMLPPNWISVGRELKKRKPDLIVVRYWLPVMGPALGTILRIVRKNKHTKIVCIADNVIPHEKRAGDKLFTKYFIKSVDKFIVMSDRVFDDLKTFDNVKPILQVRHPLYDSFGENISKEEARQQLEIDADEKVMLFFGFIRKYKGLDILFDAMKILKDQSQNIKLIVAGEFYEDKKPFEDQIVNLGIKDSLILHTDFISDNEVKKFFCAADVVVQPYRSATQSGVTPLAYHFEVPMIVTNVGGLPAMVPEGKVGLIAEPTAAALAEKVIAYFEKGESFFKPYLIEEKKKFSWKKLTDAITDSSN